MLECQLFKGDDEARVRVQGAEVVVTVNGATSRRRYRAVLEQAGCVFEANVEAFVAEGWCIVEEHGDSRTPGCLDVFSSDESELYWARWHGDRLEAAGLDVADPVALWDGTASELRRARRLGRFDRGKIDPLWEPLHALRRLLVHPQSRQLEAFELVLHLAHDRVLDVLRRRGREALVTHLSLGAWTGHAVPPVALGSRFPRLMSLCLDDCDAPALLAAPCHALRHLFVASPATLGADASPPVALTTLLPLIDASAPRLESLRIAVPTEGPEPLAALLAHPLIERLRVLDLEGRRDPIEPRWLLGHRGRLAHLEHVFVVSPRIDEKQERRPPGGNVHLVSHRRDDERYRRVLARYRP